MTGDSLRELGASLVKPENLVSGSNAVQKVFQANVQLGGKEVPVRVVLNREDKLRSIYYIQD